MKLLSKLFGYSKNRKNITRELLNESKSEKTENKENKKRRRFMENEKNSVNEEVKTQDANTQPTENVKEETKVETKEETKTETNSVDNGKDKDVPTNDNGSEQPAQNAQDVPTTQPGQVQETPPQGNGVRVEDLVTKEELAEKFAALEAKYEAVIKENTDLKNKYENPDFGNHQRQGLVPQDEEQRQYEDFDSYSKKFMQ